MNRNTISRRTFAKGFAGMGAVALTGALGLAGCGGESTGNGSAAPSGDGTTYKIGVLRARIDVIPVDFNRIQRGSVQICHRREAHAFSESRDPCVQRRFHGERTTFIASFAD